MHSRRSFLRTLGIGGAAALLSLRLFKSLDAPLYEPMLPKSDPGISIRFVREFKMETGTVSRLDCIYGFGTLHPEFAVRVTREYSWWERFTQMFGHAA